MIKLAKKRGWVSHEQINAVLPSEEVTSDRIEDVFAMLNEMGINVVETEEAEAEPEEEAQEEEEEANDTELVEVQAKPLATVEKKEPTERTDDPVRMYLREIRHYSQGDRARPSPGHAPEEASRTARINRPTNPIQTSEARELYRLWAPKKLIAFTRPAQISTRASHPNAPGRPIRPRRTGDSRGPPGLPAPALRSGRLRRSAGRSRRGARRPRPRSWRRP